MDAQAESAKAKQILEEEALKEKAAQIRAKEQNDEQKLVDMTLAQGMDERKISGIRDFYVVIFVYPFERCR